MLTLNASPPGRWRWTRAEKGFVSSPPVSHSAGVASPLSEDQLRSERWETLRGRVESMVQKSQLLGQLGPQPAMGGRDRVLGLWDAGSDMPWWFVHADKPCLQSASARGSAALLEILEGGPAGPTQSDGTGLDHPAQEARALVRGGPSARPTWQGADTAYGTGKRPDSRFLHGGNGKQMVLLVVPE